MASSGSVSPTGSDSVELLNRVKTLESRVAALEKKGQPQPAPVQPPMAKEL